MLKRLAEMMQEMDGGRLEWTAARTNERGLNFYPRHGATRRENAYLLRLDRTALRELSEK